MKNVKKVLSCVLAFAMIMTMLAVPTFAGSDKVAKIDTTEYETLQSAVNAVTSGQTIVLIDNVTTPAIESFNGPVSAKTFTIDLNGKTWTSTNTNVISAMYTYLTIADSVGTGVITNEGATEASSIDATAMFDGAVNSTFTFTGGTIKNYSDLDIVGGFFDQQYNFNGSNIESLGNGGLINDGGFNPIPPTVEITGGEFKGIDVEEIEEYLPENAKVDENGKVTSYIAAIGDAKYETLAEAIAAVAENDTIELLGDYTSAGITVDSKTTFTLDLNGYTLTFGPAGAGSANTKTNGLQLLKDQNVTIKDGTINMTAANKDFTWTSASTTKGIAILIQNYCDLTLDNVTIDAANIAHNGGTTARYAVSNNSGDVAIVDSTITTLATDFAFDSCKYASYEAPVVTVENSTINGKVEATGGAIDLAAGTVMNGQLRVGENVATNACTGSVVTIEDGATVNGVVAVFGQNTLNIAGDVNGYVGTNGNAYNAGSVINVLDGAEVTAVAPYDVAIYIPNGTLNVSGGTVTGDTAIYVKAGSLNVTDGNIVATGAKADYNYSGNGANPTGDAIVIDSCNYPSAIDSVSISGGTVTSANADAIGNYVLAGAEAVENFVSGGTFSSAVPADLCAEGFVAVPNEINGEVIYAVLSEEDNAELIPDDTVTLELAGRIALNFYIDADAYLKTAATKDGAYITLTYNANNTYSTNRTTFTTLIKDAKKVDGKYVVTATVNPAQIAEIASVALYTASGVKLMGFDYSVLEYCDFAIDNWAGTSYAKFATLCQGIVQYGYASQIAFGYNTSNLCVSAADIASGRYGSTASITSANAPEYDEEGTVNGCEVDSISFYCLSTATLSIHIANTANCTATIKNKPANSNATVVVKDGSIDIEGIESGYLDYSFEVEISDGTNTMTVSSSVLNYCDIAFEYPEYVGQNFVNLCKAVVMYNNAANAAFGL